MSLISKEKEQELSACEKKDGNSASGEGINNLDWDRKQYSVSEPGIRGLPKPAGAAELGKNGIR